MSVSPIGSSSSAIYGTLFSGITSVNSNSQDGSNGGNCTSGVAAGGGKLASAISQVLSQLGVSSPTASSGSDASDTSSTQDPQQALSVFMQNLFAALQGQSGTQGPTPGSSPQTDNANSGNGTSAVAGTSGGHHHHHHGGGMGKLESGLQNLIQQLSTSSGQSGTGTSTSDSDSGASGSTLDALQESFNNLLGAEGASGSNATLSSFLQSLAQNLQGASTAGNVVATQA